MTDNKIGFWKRSGIYLGLIEDRTEVRSELPILGTPYQPINVVNLSTYNDQSGVSADRALSLVATYRAVNILSTSVSQLPLGVWRAGIELPQSSNSLVIKPNIDLSLPAFLEQTTLSLAVAGNAYWLLNRNSPTATVSNIEVLNPHVVFKTTDEKTGKTVYRYGDKTYPAWRIKHLFYTRLPGYATGIGPIQAAQNELRGALNLRNYADNFIGGGSGIPKGILKTDQTINSEQADALKNRWTEANSGYDIAVLGNGLEFTPLLVTPEQAQFLQSQQFSKTQIATMFGIPANYMLADSNNSNTYQNMAHVDAAFVKYTLQKYLTEIESALSDLLPRGQEAKFKVEALLRGDHASRSAFYASAVGTGWMTVDEVRVLEGLPPLTQAVNSNEGVTEDGQD